MKSRKIIKTTKQKIYLLMKERDILVWNLYNSMPVNMIAANLSYVYRKCGKQGCKCQTGDKHGPYPAIQLKIKNKRTIKMIKKDDVDEIEKKVNQYKEYQDGLASINKLNKKIHELLKERRNKNLEQYP